MSFFFCGASGDGWGLSAGGGRELATGEGACLAGASAAATADDARAPSPSPVRPSSRVTSLVWWASVRYVNIHLMLCFDSHIYAFGMGLEGGEARHEPVIALSQSPSRRRD